jgi:membrane protease YdiL (CAAX protease family)
MPDSPRTSYWERLRQLPPNRTEQLFEVLVFLFLIVPSLAFSFFAAQQSAGFALTAAATILRDLALLALILFFVWRNGETLHRLGWTPRNFWLEAGIGLGLFIPFTLSTGLLEQALERLGLTAPPAPPSFLMPSGAGQIVLAFFLVAVVAVAEETIFRGYLILRFNKVTRSLVAAVVIATGIFALGHGYEGSAGLTTVAYMGLVFAVVYIWRGSLVAPMILHFLQDFLGIVLLPILSRR